MESTDLVPVPGTDLVPDGWCERTVIPWADEQLEQASIANATAQVAGLLEAYKTLGADTLELTKARRYLEVRWGELLGEGKRGNPNFARSRNSETPLATEVPKDDRHRFRQLAADRDRVVEQIRTATDPEELSRTRLLRTEKEHRRDARRDENRVLVEQAPRLADLGERFSAIVLDPPWDWGDEGDADQLGRARPTYATMPLEEIAAEPIGELAAENAHLYLWITNRSLPKGFGLLERWGFRYVTMLTWVKPSIGMGNYFRGSTEQVLFGVRGSLPLLRADVGTYFMAPRPPQHSQKPDEFYALVESCSPGPWLEWPARRARPGWVVSGAEVPDAS